MGISPFKSSSACGCTEPVTAKPLPTAGMPNPRKFTMERIHGVGHWTAIRVRYHDATNFEGRKILVFRDVRWAKLEKLDYLDPHFCEAAHISPVARFVPTSAGWAMALDFITLMSEKGM